MESITGGSFSNFCSWGSGLMSSVCAHSCCDKQHYHRHCGCALHSIDTEFKGTPSCSPSRTVRVSGPASRTGMYRSLSVQNFGDKKFSPACSSHGSSFSGDESVSTFDFSPNSSDFDLGSEALSPGRGSLPSAETLILVEELASFIHLMKDEDSCSTSDEENEEYPSGRVGLAREFFPRVNSTSSLMSEPFKALAPKPATRFIGRSADQQLTSLLPSALPMVMELSAIFLPVGHDDVPLRAPSLDQISNERASAFQKAERLGGHRKIESYCG